jgi:hypothetical protein
VAAGSSRRLLVRVEGRHAEGEMARGTKSN